MSKGWKGRGVFKAGKRGVIDEEEMGKYRPAYEGATTHA
jgi:hypothetical protein